MQKRLFVTGRVPTKAEDTNKDWIQLMNRREARDQLASAQVRIQTGQHQLESIPVKTQRRYHSLST